MAGDLSFWEKDKYGSLLCFTVLQLVSVSQPTGHGNQLQLIIKITRSFGSGFQKQRLQSQMPDWSWLRTKSPKQRFMSDHIGNILVCVITTHCFFLFVYFSAIMFIFFMWVELFLGLTFLHPDTIVKDFLFEIHTHIRDTYYARVGCC